MNEVSMQQVVQRLRDEDSAALIELRAFHAAFNELLRSLALLAVAGRKIESEAQEIQTPGPTEATAHVRVLQDRLCGLNVCILQILRSVRAMHRGIVRWDIADSVQPFGDPNPSPPSAPERKP